MPKILSSKLAEVARVKGCSMSTISSITGVDTNKIYNNDVSDDDLNRIASFLAVKQSFLTTARHTYSDNQDLKQPLNYSCAITGKKKADGTTDRRTLNHNHRKGKRGLAKDSIPNKIDMELLKLLVKERGFSMMAFRKLVNLEGVNLKTHKGIRLTTIQNICFYLKCKPDDFYNGTLDYIEVERVAEKRDEFKITTYISKNAADYMSSKIHIPSDIIQYLPSTYVNRSICEDMYYSYCEYIDCLEKRIPESGDFCTCKDIPKYGLLVINEEEKARRIEEAERKVDNNSSNLDIHKDSDNGISKIDIEKQFYNLIHQLTNEELNAFKQAIEAEHQRRVSEDAMNKILNKQ